MVRSLRGSFVLCLAFSVVAAPSVLRAQVVVNEIHYHPSNAAVAAGEDAERLQFVELHNRGAATADLSGWFFSDGLTYTFPAGTTLAAGAYVVLAKDPAFLALRGPAVPAGVAVLKWTSGDLNNGGETLTLVNATAAVQDTVTYGDAGLWPAAADGAGPSLELANPAYDKSFPLAWRASAGNDGTPGKQNSRYTAAPIVLLDAPARNSVVGTLAQVAVTFSGPVTGVAAGSLVVDGSAATAVTGSGAGPYVFTGFAVPKANPFVATLAAGAISGGGVAFGGDSWTYFQSVPKVVINEIHYNPLSSTDDEEFIELYNADPGPVNVGGWKVVEFASPGCAIPAGTVMQPGTYLVCAKDPAALQAATGFGAALSWGTNDSLSNGGEPISLLNGSGAVVDRVEYNDDPPWPAGPGSPDGNGPSLELTNPGLDNAMGQFWRASAAANGTPGARNSAFGEAPVVATEAPARGAVIVTLPTVSVTFSKAVTGVTADDLEVDGVPATGVIGSGAGPYVFTTGGATGDAVTVVLNAGGIADEGGRPFAGDAWLYFVGLPRLVLNEIHYHPAATAVGAGEDPELLQFIEIYNDDAEPVDLTGFALSDGVGLVFPAGTVIEGFGFVVVARDSAFLKSKVAIPAGVPVLAWTSGDLGNGGETIRVSDPYGREIDVVKYDDKGDWTDAPDGNGPSLELIHPALANDRAGSWQASTPVNGTPGKTNSRYVASPAPAIWGAAHFPPIPKGGQSVTITVFAIDEGGAAPAVTLMYRQDQDPPIAYSSTPMFDDGNHGDGDAGDGRFGAVVPGLADGQQLDFFVTASDGGATAVAPAGHAVNDSHGYPSQTYLCKFSNEVLPNDLPVYHIIVTRVNKRFQEAATTEIARKTPYDSTFIDDKGRVFYNVVERYRGQSSIYKFPSSYSIDFPSNRKLDSVLGWKVDTLQLNGMRPAAQALGFDLFNRAGVPAPKTAFVRLRYTGINYDTCCNGQNGYYGAHVVVERYDNAFLDSQGGDVANRGLSSEGQLYRGRNNADFRWLGTDKAAYRTDANDKGGYQKYNRTTEDFWGDLIPVIDALSNSSADRYVEHVRAHVDVDNFARFFAIHMLLGNREGGLYRDTGDDYFVWFRPVGDPANPPHPDYGTAQMPAERTSNAAVLMPWDTDSILWDANETIWRTSVAAMRTFLRHNAFAPIFVGAIEDVAANQFSPATMNAVIDAMPAQVFATKDGSDLWPETKQQYKNWIANRVAYCLNETVDDLTLTGVPASPYEGADPLLHLSGRLQQAGTHAVTVNGAPATFDVYAATWSFDLTLKQGWNPILVQAWDRDGKEKDRVDSPVMWNPAGTATQLHLELRTPRRMLNDKTLTIEARILDPINRIAWQNWETFGKVSVVRLPDRTPVPVTMTKFNDHVALPNGTLRFVNGWGSVSFTLDQGAAFAGSDVEVSVEWNHLRAARTVTVLAGPTMRSVSGVLSGANLTWGPDEVIRVTGNCTVPAGQTLRIHPGTLVQVNTTGTLENGTLITVQGNLQAVGARDNPVFFFSERGASAMTLTQSGSASNGNAWRGLQFYGTGSSTMRYVFVTGAGNGNVVSHPRPPILGMFSTHSLNVDYSVFADNCGMAFSGQGTGKYTIRRNLVSRVGIGGEFFGNGHTLDIRDTWWTNVGHAPEANNLDGDLLHVDGPNSKQTIRSCIIADGGDDGIDHNGSNFAVEHTIIYGVRDKAISMTGGHVTATNMLAFECGTGIRGTASTDHVTIATGGPIAANDEIFRTIVWPSSVATCSGDVSYSYVGNASDLGCGDGNASINPQYTSTAAKDYNPKPGSPALTAGPDGERIGWLGFPYGATCKTGADCNDENACTADTCVNKLCVFTPILGCVPCETDTDCDDGEPCTSDVCAYDGSCTHPLAPTGTTCNDGKACTSPDTCTNGVCGGPEACPVNQHCDDKGACAGGGGEPVTVTFQQGVNGYSGTHDTFLREYRPDTAYGQGTSLWWDLEDPKPNQDVGLVRFADVFGPEPGRIPSGVLVTSAVLTVNVEFIEQGGPGAAGAVSEAWAGWDEATATWNNFGGEPGVQPDEYGPMVAAAPTKLGSASIDVTAQIQAWAFNPAGNNGWIFLANSASWIGITTSEGTIVANRPKLTVTYEPPGGGCVSDAFCDDGRFCNGKETCNVPAKKCVAGVPPTCDDAIDCTADACDAVANACANVPDHAACDDGDVCTDDVCVVGAGGGCANPAKTPACDDGVACTTDSCDPIEGCTFTDSCGAGFECDLPTGTCRKGATVATFQQGVAGYDGTLDTYVHAGAPDADNSLATTLLVDGVPPDAEQRQILLRFDRIFGTDPGQVPAGSPIAEATLTVFVTNPSADGAGLFRMVRTWADTDTWNSLVGGVSTDGVEALAEADASGATNANRVAYDIDVTKSVVAWSGGQANLGWAFVMPAGGTDSWQLSSSEELEESERPKLTIRYLPCEPGWTGDGVTCNDFNECGLADPPCDPHAKCTNFVGGYSCECDPGWEGDGATCTDVDECSANTYPCDANATCTNEPGAYVCACKPGFEGNGKTCADRDECSWVPFPCDANADCANKPGSFACTCKDGFVGNGATCGECPGGAADPCSGRGECAGTAAAPACKCDDGFGGDACEDCLAGLWGPACDQPCTGGAENPCNDHGDCLGGMAGTGACTCYVGFAGDACDACAPGYFAYPDCTNCPQCSDGNVCTDDSCDPVTGCVNAFNTSACDDGNACTLEDSCSGGECLGQVVDCIDDGDECTEESCDPATGLCSSTPIPGCGTPDTDPDAVADGSEGTPPDPATEPVPDPGTEPDTDPGTESGTEPVPDSGPGDDTQPGEDGQPVGDEGQGDGAVPPDAWDGDVDSDALNLPDGVKVKVGGGGGCSSAAGTGAGVLPAVLLPGLLVLGDLLRRRRRD